VSPALVRLTTSGFTLPIASNRVSREVEAVKADKVPVMRWPDGKWCLPANVYMLTLWERGLSRRGRGGTLATYAANVTHLLRFCYDEGLEIHDLNDSDFVRFVGQLRQVDEQKEKPRARDDTTVCQICSNCMDLIQSVADFRQDPHLIGKEGRIRGYKVPGKRRDELGRRSDEAQETVWKHPALPKRDPARRRHPISQKNISKLREAVLHISPSLHQRVRRYAMLTALEFTGGRRTEVASLRVADVIAAAQSPTNALRLLTVKRPGGKDDHRWLPVATGDLLGLLNYIRVNRKSVIRKTIGPSHDHGYVFVNERTGAPLEANTVTQEVHLLAKSAGISTVTCPHMFRHRYITKIFIQLIEQHKLTNKSDLRLALLSTKQLKQQLLQWTGHRRIESFERYVDYAFEEIANISVSLNQVLKVREVEAVQKALGDLARDLDSGDRSVSSDMLRDLAQALSNRSSSN
jgi:integrase